MGIEFLALLRLAISINREHLGLGETRNKLEMMDDGDWDEKIFFHH